uniref:Uncharacterized protein n=1 Tax=Aegilops tauschii subsp. strangulata TaxID=200361 RepID=A0A453MFV7_AEGTS
MLQDSSLHPIHLDGVGGCRSGAGLGAQAIRRRQQKCNADSTRMMIIPTCITYYKEIFLRAPFLISNHYCSGILSGAHLGLASR